MQSVLIRGQRNMHAIYVKNLSKHFKIKIKENGLSGSLKSLFSSSSKEVKAVNNISFSVKKGEILAFIGPNGAGKSTTIKMLTSILHPDSGEIEVLGLNPVEHRKKLAYKIGTVFGQKEQLWPHLTARDNFKFFAAIYDLEGEKAKRRIDELCRLFGLDDIIDTPVKSLSLGQRIRCEIAASILHNPEILFLDEPTIGLDPVVKENVRELIKTLNKECGTTIFLTSHDIGDIEKLCKRIIIMNHGKIIIDSSMTDLHDNYLTKKILEIKTRGAAKIPQLEGIKILENEKSLVRLEVDTSKEAISNVVKKLNYDNISDITISNIPLENIIAKIYSTKNEN